VALGVALLVATPTLALVLSRTDAPASRSKDVAGGSFASAIDAGWTLRARAGAAGLDAFALSSTRAPLNAQGIPPKGAIGISISESAASTLAGLPPEASAENPQTRTADAVALLSTVVRPPANAQDVAVTDPVHFRTLAGASAAEAAYEYAYEGHASVQVDVVARRHGTIYFVELDADVAKMSQGEAALARLLAQWRWK
jgi:hypothetical protein